ncbi:MAG: hypothetical protein HHAS10_09720 [Candidatus Altimarinota bacterium]
MIPNLFFAINEDCNLDCTYCNVKKSKQKLSLEKIIEGVLYFIKFFPEATGYNIFFTGGEPLLSFREIVSATYFLKKLEKKIGRSFSIHIPTNGTLLTDERIAFFVKNNITISLSIDSLDIAYSERPFVGKSLVPSQSVIAKIFPNIKKYANIFRIKMVATPQEVPSIERTFGEFYQLGFRFINIQPAHGVYWSKEAQDSYIETLLSLRKNLENFPGLESTTLKKSGSHTHTMKRCAKGISEICIDSYGNILTCDAFLAYSPDIRKSFAFDSLEKPGFDREKFRKGSDWKYCQNEIIAHVDGTIDYDLTHCKTCNESISCTKLCNAVPINGQELDSTILLSNFELFRRIDSLI